MPRVASGLREDSNLKEPQTRPSSRLHEPLQRPPGLLRSMGAQQHEELWPGLNPPTGLPGPGPICRHTAALPFGTRDAKKVTSVCQGACTGDPPLSGKPFLFKVR